MVSSNLNFNRKSDMKPLSIAACTVIIVMSFAASASDSQTSTSMNQTERPSENYMPGMGEIMAATQMRHSKLWFAGKAGNWELASYELDEIEEGLADAVKYHPVFKKDAPVSAMLDKFTTQPLQNIRRAIEAKDSAKFKRSFDSLTSACNACHQAASQGFIVIKRPGILPFSNQDVTVKTK